MRFLIFGANGLVGKSMLRELKFSEHIVFASDLNVSSDSNDIKCNILDSGDLQKTFIKAQPQVVINATNLAGGVDFCENNPELAKKFHTDANIQIGKLCKQYNSGMVLISTDYVFDGNNPPYKENDKTNPLNKYGQYKLDAELWMHANLKNYIIVRTTNVFGWDPLTKTPNFLMGLYFKLKENQIVNVPSFLSGNPTHVSCLTKAIIELIEKNAIGIYHVVGSSFVNRYEWALKFSVKLDFDKNLIKEVKEIPLNIIPRPLNSNLSINKFTSSYKTILNDVDSGLDLFQLEMMESLKEKKFE